jgi:hypothetical protein
MWRSSILAARKAVGCSTEARDVAGFSLPVTIEQTPCFS